MSIPNRYLSLGELIGTSLKTGFRFFPMIAVITALTSLPAPLSNYFSTRMTALSASLSSSLAGIMGLLGVMGFYLLVVIAQSLFSYLLSALLIGEMHRYLSGDETPFDLNKALGEAARVWFPLVLASFLTTLLTILGIFFFIVPGLIFMCAFAIVVPVVIVEKRGIIGSIERSWKLTKGLRLPIFGTLLLLGLISLGIILIPAIGIEVTKQLVPVLNPESLSIPSLVFVYLQNLLYGCIGSIVSTPAVLLIFYNCKFRNEGVSSGDLNTEFDKPMPGPEL